MIMTAGYLLVTPLALFVKDPGHLYHSGNRFWSITLLKLGRIKLMVEGAENIPSGKNYIFAANHASLTDILIMAAAIPNDFLFVMDEELFDIPFLGGYCKRAGYLPISRRNPTRAYKNVLDIIERLKSGKSIVFFPEGGRSKDGKLRVFKGGIGKLVIDSGVEVIPVASIGSFGILYPSSIVIHPGRVTVKIGKPIKFDPAESENEIAEKLHAQIAAMLAG